MNIPFTADQLLIISERAAEKGVSPERFVRDLVVSRLPRPRVRPDVAAFVREHCDTDPCASTSNTELYQAYVRASRTAGSHRAFTQSLNALGFFQAPGRQSGRMVEGLRLRTR